MEARQPAIGAVVYSQGREVDHVLRRVVRLAEGRNLRCAGFVQVDELRPGRSRCDMRLECLSTGTAIAISEDRGPYARGCRLDVGELLRVMSIARDRLARGTDLLVVNKFGKTEAEGGGFRSLVSDAVAAGVPVLIGVPWRNIEPWRLFATDLAIEWPVGDLAALADDGLLERLQTSRLLHRTRHVGGLLPVLPA